MSFTMLTYQWWWCQRSRTNTLPTTPLWSDCNKFAYYKQCIHEIFILIWNLFKIKDWKKDKVRVKWFFRAAITTQVFSYILCNLIDLWQSRLSQFSVKLIIHFYALFCWEIVLILFRKKLSRHGEIIKLSSSTCAHAPHGSFIFTCKMSRILSRLSASSLATKKHLLFPAHYSDWNHGRHRSPESCMYSCWWKRTQRESFWL